MGHPTSSSTRRTYLMACAGKSAQDPRIRGRLFPAFDGLIDRLDAGLRALACREMIDLLAVELVADTHFDRVETVENIELGECQTMNAAGAGRLAHQHGIEPAAAPLPAGVDAEFPCRDCQSVHRSHSSILWEKAPARRASCKPCRCPARNPMHSGPCRFPSQPVLPPYSTTSRRDKCRDRRRAAPPARLRTACACLRAASGRADSIPYLPNGSTFGAIARRSFMIALPSISESDRPRRSAL